jgi:hypothetical protein
MFTGGKTMIMGKFSLPPERKLYKNMKKTNTVQLRITLV